MKKSEKDKMISGELYNAFCSELIADRECANVLFSELNTIGKATQKKREDILKKLFGKCGKNVWIGGWVVICPGVSIGNKTIIGAGSVVTKDIPCDVVSAGNPCKIIKKI